MNGEVSEPPRGDVLRVVLGIGAPVAVAALYIAFLGYRTDYPGHFLAGFGGTLGTLGVLSKVLPRRLFDGAPAAWILAGTLACVAFGGALEGSVFRMQRFDPLDFFNQTLGAAFAGAAALLATSKGPMSPLARGVGAVASLWSLAAGFLLAFH